MGLDSVEFVMAIEEAFGLDVPDADAAQLLTPRMLIDYLWGRLPPSDEEGCLSQRTFYFRHHARRKRRRFRKVGDGYDPTDREAAYAHVRRLQQAGEVVPGLLHIDESAPDMHATNNTFEAQLADLRYEDLCPGSQALRELQEEFR